MDLVTIIKKKEVMTFFATYLRKEIFLYGLKKPALQLAHVAPLDFFEKEVA